MGRDQGRLRAEVSLVKKITRVRLVLFTETNATLTITKGTASMWAVPFVIVGAYEMPCTLFVMRSLTSDFCSSYC